MAIVAYIPDQTVSYDGADPPERESGGKLTFYLYGTLTKTPVYQDPGGTPSANPVLSLADGTWPAIYWQNQIRTRVIKTSPSGATDPATWEVADIGPTTSGGSGTVPVTEGGTGLTSYTIGDILYASATTTLAKLADVAVGNVLLSGGVGVAPAYGKVSLTAHVANLLPIANGGTASSTIAAFRTTMTPAGSLAYVDTGTAAGSGKIGVGTSAPGTLAIGEIYFRYDA